MDQLNFIERVFDGRSKAITYVMLGFLGSGLVGYIVLSFYSLLGSFAENHRETIPPALVIYIGLVGLTTFGLAFSIWLWVGCWKYAVTSIRSVRFITVFLTLAHIVLVISSVYGLFEFNVLVIEYLNEDGRFILNQ
jgi:hypothetical protein